MSINILVVDDDEDIRELIVEALGKIGATVHQAGDGVEAMGVFEKEKLDVIVTDIRMPNCDGIELMRRLRTSGKKVPGLVVITGFKDVATSEIMLLGGNEVLIKPFEIAEVIQSVQGCLRTIRRAV